MHLPKSLSIAAVLLLVPGWTGETRLALLGARAEMRVARVPLDPRDPARTRVGRLSYLGGVALTSRDPAFGGFSALAVAGDRFTLLGDGGTVVGFRMGADWRPHALRFANLPAGPGTGWEKRDRDSESMATDPASGRIWTGFESRTAIWRYAPGFARAERASRPWAMRRWPGNGGPESLVRTHDGRFLVLAETARYKGRRGTRTGLVFARDPVDDPRPAFAFAYRPARGYHPADATELPDGRILVLERGFSLPFAWRDRLVLVDRAAIRPGADVRGEAVATLAAPLVHDNFEGVSAVREGSATILWIVSDDNDLILQRSLLLKFRLD